MSTNDSSNFYGPLVSTSIEQVQNDKIILVKDVNPLGGPPSLLPNPRPAKTPNVRPTYSTPTPKRAPSLVPAPGANNPGGGGGGNGPEYDYDNANSSKVLFWNFYLDRITIEVIVFKV